MGVYNVVLSNAFVAFLTAPLRRIRYLVTVEDDLIEEGILPPQGFGSTIGCLRFLYHAGGRSLGVFYRGAMLEVVGCIGKYELQRIVAIPIARRVPLRMQHAVLATTLLHTALVYFTVAPLQCALDTIAVNSVTTFTAEETGGKRASPALEPVQSASAENGKNDPSLPSSPVRLRFSGTWDTARYLVRHFPVRSMVSRLYLLEFGCRYVTSLANNKILTWLMMRAQKHYNGTEMTGVQRLVLYAGCPLVASLAMSVLTYPFATYPVAHFLRLRYYERCAEETARKAAEVAHDYPVFAQHGGATASRTADGDTHNSSNSHSSTSTSLAVSADGRRRPGEVERFWWEEVFFRSVHSEVRDFLWKSMYGREGCVTALAFASTSTTPVTASPTSAAAAQQCPVGAGGRSSGKRGIRQVYRGFGLVVVSTLLSSALAIALNRAIDFAAHHAQ
ncbi:putative ADP/ATP mitochondrial translocase [Leptomonas pyrrhocoris]|uniref:Putative ADP/ATP mitochondrial translocase n=1 Tax=Leptomonas pyrrhocoris TaxID=157538 RepID=A0A0M9FWC5_LEPPY|nr:putative ADP/ATP mitochondrial translocase [Leptomonas pyrrhocoris]XP_015655736.1 putative ADP/ATP mitochondrial translocase [Leptomonas pyrrhocoris]KPA77296.1 putative ADP/ATP mitochondrial translocase [Leptomonas pyrrhocoris]KPA77297.1 putative ADP/ATP mitochondrial translocase [Leptomonas pyrrhocoris]|eukprot:XP_015655735.1 putative ADP/ATP mitochondrial translocase [Leptomonas pyrrhocoris]